MLEDARRKGFALAWFHADFLAGANLENGNSHVLLQSILRFFKFLQGRRKKDIFGLCDRRGVVNRQPPKRARLRLDPGLYERLRNQVLPRDGWRCQFCGAMSNLEVHHDEFRSQSGDDSDENLITQRLIVPGTEPSVDQMNTQKIKVHLYLLTPSLIRLLAWGQVLAISSSGLL